jgi:predicted transcriptional regulator
VTTSSVVGLEQFLRHARLFGSDLVIETAEPLLTERELVRLRVEIDSLVRRSSRRLSRSPRRRRPTEETMLAAVAMREEGFVIGYIAEKLGVTEKTVRELLARHRRESASPQGPHQGLDRPLRPPKTAWLSGENAAETAATYNDSRKSSQPQSGEATHGSAQDFRKEPYSPEGTQGKG